MPPLTPACRLLPLEERFTNTCKVNQRTLADTAAFPGVAADRNLILAAWNIEHLAAEDDRGCRPREAADYKAIRRYLSRPVQT